MHKLKKRRKTMKLSKRILALALAVVMALSAFALASCSDKNYAENNTKIKIGMTGPLTGGAAIYGIAVRNSATLAVEEINAAGGLKVGDQSILFEFEMIDDKHDKDNVAPAYATLYEGGMQISLGTVTTKPGLEYKVLSQEDNVFFLTPSATADGIPEFSNGYQMCFADSKQGGASAKYFNENYQGKVIGIFYKSDDDYSKGIYEQFMANIDTTKITVDPTNIKSFTEETSTSFTQQVTDLADCDVIFMPTYYDPASLFMKQGVGVIKSDAVYFGCDGFDGIDAIEGFDIAAIPQEVSMLTHFVSTATTGPAAEFIAKYNARFDSTKEPVNQFGASAYDCVYAIYEALKAAVANGTEVSANMSPSEFCDILTGVFNSDTFEFYGITGDTTGGQKCKITWAADGTVEKSAMRFPIKEKNS